MLTLPNHFYTFWGVNVDMYSVNVNDDRNQITN